MTAKMTAWQSRLQGSSIRVEHMLNVSYLATLCPCLHVPLRSLREWVTWRLQHEISVQLSSIALDSAWISKCLSYKNPETALLNGWNPETTIPFGKGYVRGFREQASGEGISTFLVVHGRWHHFRQNKCVDLEKHSLSVCEDV